MRPSAEAKIASQLMARGQLSLSELRGPMLRVLEMSMEWLAADKDRYGRITADSVRHHSKQLRPLASDSDDIWIRAGRGWGKSLTLVYWVIFKLFWSGVFRPRVAIVGRTGADVRQTLLESDEGLLAKLPTGTITKSDSMDQAYRLFNGAYFRLFSSEQPNALRGPNFNFGAGDETSSWRYIEALHNFELCVRLGHNPQKLHATTPKRNDITKYLAATNGIEVIRGSTSENKENLSERFIQRVYSRFAGTILEQQELHGELLDEAEGALFKVAIIQKGRISPAQLPVKFLRCVVGIDPQAVQSQIEEEYQMGSETGIIGAASARLEDGKLHYFVLGDFTVRARPEGWGSTSERAAKEIKADYFVAETNQGGDMVIEILRHHSKRPVRRVHQQRGKRLRAEEVSLLYERGLVHHVGFFGDLESQMTTWTGFPEAKEKSPDRLDALVLALAELALDDTTFSGLLQVDVGGGGSRRSLE